MQDLLEQLLRMGPHDSKYIETLLKYSDECAENAYWIGVFHGFIAVTITLLFLKFIT